MPHAVLCCVQGFDLNRTVLVDNDDYKAADGEHENMLHVPHWEQTEGGLSICQAHDTSVSAPHALVLGVL